MRKFLIAYAEYEEGWSGVKSDEKMIYANEDYDFEVELVRMGFVGASIVFVHRNLMNEKR